MKKVLLLFIILCSFSYVVAKDTQSEQQLKEISEKLDNPLSDLWILYIRNVTGFAESESGGKVNYNLVNIKPVIPFILGNDYLLVLRPAFTYVAYGTKDPTGVKSNGGSWLNPKFDVMFGKNFDRLSFALGPTIVFPFGENFTQGYNSDTTSIDSDDKYMYGFSGVLKYDVTKEFTIGGLYQQWSNFSTENNINKAELQYFMAYSLDYKNKLAMAPVISIDYNAPAGQRIMFPIGLSYSRTAMLFGKMPLRFMVGVQTTLIKPKGVKSNNSIVIMLLPVFPKSASSLRHLQKLKAEGKLKMEE